MIILRPRFVLFTSMLLLAASSRSATEERRVRTELSSIAVPRTENYDKIDLDRETPVPADVPVPIYDFFRPRLLSQPSLNPSGSHILAVVSSGRGGHQLLVYEVATQKIEIVGVPGDRDIYSAQWLNDKRLIFQLSARKLYGVGLLAAEVGSLQYAYPLLQYYYSAVVAVPKSDPIHPFIWNRHDSLESTSNRDLGLAIINTNLNNGPIVDLLAASSDWSLASGVKEKNERHIIQRFPAPAGGNVTSYINDVDGQPDFAVTALDGVLTLHRFVEGRWEKCPVDLEHTDLLGAGDHHGQLVVSAPPADGKPRAVRYLDGATGQLGEPLLQDPGYDFYSSGISDGWLYREPKHFQIIGAVFDRAGPEVVWFTQEYAALQKILNGFFPGLVVRILGSDEAQKRFLVSTFSDREPPVYQWVDLEKRTAGLFKRSEPWIDPARMQPMTPIKFKTRDGKRLDAYLTLPAGASRANPPPLVVLPHGGPWARDSWGYDGEVQFLASRGYAVLQPNYRGSNGTAWMFPESDSWDFWKMHEDVTDATKAMIASGLVDKQRVAIMGGSFGGYLAVSGVVNEPDLYRCAVTIAGVFDWEQQVLSKKYDQYDSPVFAYMMRKLGDPAKKPAMFDHISPGRRTERIKVPVLVSGGTEDQTVEIEQSRTLIANLKKHGVPHEAYIVAEEGHGMRHLDKEVELYARIEAFLAKNLAKP